MKLRAEINIGEHVCDEDGGAGESSMNGNLFFEFQFVPPSQKQLVRDVLTRHYKEICAELKNIS